MNNPNPDSGRLERVELNGYSGVRIDRALAAAYPSLSRRQWQVLIKDGRVTVNDRPIKASQKVEGDVIATADIPAPATTDLIAEPIPLDIRFEDDALLVVNKPAGMVVHPAVGHASGTLVNAILHHCPDLPGIGGEIRPGIVHRLDKDTSGLIVIAKTDHALRFLQAQFKARTVHKVYLALLEGNIQPELARIDAPIGRDPKQRKRMSVIAPGTSANSRLAQTSYEIAERFAAHSLVRCTPHTGRTHQIRVHMAYIGYPLVGDAVYGRRKQKLLTTRHFLHAAELGLVHPVSEQTVRFTAELPAELQSLLTDLRQLT